MVQLIWLTTQPVFIAKCGTSGMPISIAIEGRAQPPDWNSCVKTPVSSVVTGAPNAPLSHTPQNRASIGTVMSPSLVIASPMGAIGSRP